MGDVEPEEEIAAEAPADEEETEQLLDPNKPADEEIAQELEEEGIDEDAAGDDVEEDPFELLNEDSDEDEEQLLMYREYLDLTKQIDCQNDFIKEMKDRMTELQERPCKTRQDKAEYKRLRTCLDNENIKLHSMMNRAVLLQNAGSRRLYGDIELATTDLEENMFELSSSCRTTIKFPTNPKRPLTADEICEACENRNSESDDGC